ncbi:tannase/feruloyl esterase family alpha/beta hydrolase [Novosphingobium flavum]|uniref:Tannase/feruloyl esterase family alpha/beta hydrolase n=1 Tax=Novosphingobium aerophilum TaxID=2839843 RepID=A0A7X1F769_9SPHN|nr:tannase/feruloyl esterase family alpha/beta hydrolase [Novosphingobium aerophilum]MBC2651626.1 tannase/feruloyl esterase family alpha/beta hydrolase [Novosphingobium aerophilum]MBC2661462.1 tannase/feruloyl esterase family alpha/beta hydrolase [Novosphingobium aerophilum]
MQHLERFGLAGAAWILTTVAAPIVATPAVAATATTPSNPIACPDLARAALPDPSTVITAAALREATPAAPAPAASDGRPPMPVAAMPAHCEILGQLQQRTGANGQPYAIRFHLRLPREWNGRFVFQGGGGTNGMVGDAQGALFGQPGVTALNGGYAVISSDSGHDNAVNNDPRRQGIATFGHDAIARHNYGGGFIGPVVRTGKALIRAFYGRATTYTYFVGGSKGGQEAMMAVQRFPRDFDAALIGYPGFHLAHASIAQLWDGQAFAAVAKARGEVGNDGLPLINRAMSDADIVLAQQAILSACDGLDGTRDGMIEAFPACTTARVVPALAHVTCPGGRPADKTAQCLLPMQVAALRKVFGGARTRDGRAIYSDWAWDAGIGAATAAGVSQGWRMWKMGDYAATANNGALIRLGAPSNSAVFRSPPLEVAADVTSLSRYALTADIDQAFADAHQKWGELGESAADFMHADATDLSAFTRRGGKIILFHGVSDPVFSILDSLRWLKAVDRRERGRAGRFIRFYAVPGMNHGGGGPATTRFDIFAQLVAWRERGRAPGAITATAGPDTPWPGRSRLLCPYPQQPRRIGPDREEAGSFRCKVP